MVHYVKKIELLINTEKFRKMKKKRKKEKRNICRYIVAWEKLLVYSNFILGSEFQEKFFKAGGGR